MDEWMNWWTDLQVGNCFLYSLLQHEEYTIASMHNFKTQINENQTFFGPSFSCTNFALKNRNILQKTDLSEFTQSLILECIYRSNLMLFVFQLQAKLKKVLKKFSLIYIYVCNNKATPANVHLPEDVSMSRSKLRNSSFEAKLQIPPHDKLERKSTGLVTCGLIGKRKRKSNSVDRPAAAPDLVRTNSGSNSGSFKYGTIALITSACIFSLSESRNVSTLAIAILAAFQERSLGNLPPGDKSTITAAVTLVTIPGGEPNDFNSLYSKMAGNFLARIRNVEPTGEKHKTIFNCLRTRSIKNFQQFSRESTRPAPLTSLRTPAMIFSISSSGNRSGISPVDSISLIRTRKSSLGI
uniref:Uncharacterized protein n=1 Tax=Glossina palpalis gambiensis TaxID=67801 RepID=A0A1B0BD91_9MUSC